MRTAFDFGGVAVEAQIRVCAWLSDDSRRRYEFIILGAVITSVGYGALCFTRRTKSVLRPSPPWYPQVINPGAFIRFSIFQGGYLAGLPWSANILN